MRKELVSLNVAASATTGTPSFVGGYTNKYVQVRGIAGGCALRLQGSIDGTGWVNLGGADIAADALVSVPENVDQIRVNRTVLGTGLPVVTLIGHL